jgi:subfamily B ATP-binding cassette protein HlyB/CyaB
MNGLNATAALRTIVDLVRPDAPELSGGTSTAEIEERLRGAGIDARTVKIESPRDVDRLRLPAALRQADGSWVVFHRRGRAITADGEERIGGAAAYSAGVREAVERFPDDAVRPAITRFLLAAAREHAPALAILAGVSFAVRALFALTPELTRAIIDRALPDGARGLVEAIVVAIVLVSVTQALLQRFRGRLLIYVRAAIDTSTGRAFLRHVIHQPFAPVVAMTRGDLLQSTTGVQLARDAAFDQVVPALLEVAPALFVLALLTATSPMLAAVAAGAAAIVVAVQLAAGMRQAALQRAELTVQARHRSLFLEALSGITSIKALGCGEQLARRWSALQSREVALALRRRRVGAVGDVASEALRQSAIAAVLVWGGLQAIGGRMSLGSLVAGLQLSTMLMASAGTLAGAVASLLQVRAQLDRTKIFLRSPRLAAARAEIDGAVRVEFDDVWFRYGDAAPWVVSGYSATVEPGQQLHLASASGSGKTTLLRLVAGLHEPARGAVRINGIDAARVSGVAYLPQFPHIFAGSVLDNLRIFSAGAPLDRILRTAVETGLDEWVRSMPMAYETVLASGGGNVSGGQRQLITLTAVLASDRPLLLLDEPMANLDRATAERVWRVASRMRKTVIYAEHNAAASSRAA